jgi:hypothetical protein
MGYSPPEIRAAWSVRLLNRGHWTAADTLVRCVHCGAARRADWNIFLRDFKDLPSTWEVTHATGMLSGAEAAPEAVRR